MMERRFLPPRRLPSRCVHLPARAAAARSCHYRFRTDDDGVVDAAVAVAIAGEDGGAGYAVAIEVPANGREGGLVLRAEGSGEAVPLAPAPASGGAALAAELSYGGARTTPFHVSFLLSNAAGAEIRTHRGTSFRVPVGVGRGRPTPLGLAVRGRDGGRAGLGEGGGRKGREEGAGGLSARAKGELAVPAAALDRW